MTDDLAGQSGQFQRAAECGLRKRNRPLTNEVLAVALKKPVFFDANHKFQVAPRRSDGTDIALTGVTDPISGVDPRGNLDFQRAIRGDFAFAAATRTRIGDDDAGTAARWTGLLNLEKTLTHDHHALTTTTAAVRGPSARASPRSLTGGAEFISLDGDHLFDAGGNFFERQVEDDLKVSTGFRSCPSTITCRTGAEKSTEQIVEDVTQIGLRKSCRASVHLFDTGMAITIILSAFFGRDKDFVGFRRFLKLFFRMLVTHVAVGVILHG
jgi:hypothetical protein